MLKKLMLFLGQVSAFIFPGGLQRKLRSLGYYFYTGRVSRKFRAFGSKSIILGKLNLRGGKYIAIGKNVTIAGKCVLTAWDKDNYGTHTPQITIGEGTCIGEYAHISATNDITLGRNVLTGRWVTIVDNGHGKTNRQDMELEPMKRPFYSKGPVHIGDSVWIGDKVTILAGVSIGNNSVIAANSIVSANIPANCIAAGIPARIIKTV